MVVILFLDQFWPLLLFFCLFTVDRSMVVILSIIICIILEKKLRLPFVLFLSRCLTCSNYLLLVAWRYWHWDLNLIERLRIALLIWPLNWLYQLILLLFHLMILCRCPRVCQSILIILLSKVLRLLLYDLLIMLLCPCNCCRQVLLLSRCCRFWCRWILSFFLW